MIRTEKLTKRFGAERGVFDINLHVPQGAIYGFIGHNGAGKTTAIKILCGLLKPDSGKAYIGNYEVCPRNISMIKRMIGYMPDITGVYEQMCVWEFLDFYGAAFRIPTRKRKQRIEEVLAITRSEKMIDYQVASLSRGMRQRIGLAKTLIHDPSVLILDEPAGGLDPSARVEMRRTIKELKDLGKTILLSSHILPELASICDVVGILNKGKMVAEGTVKEITDMLHESLSIAVTVDSPLEQAMELVRGIDGVESVQASDINQFFLSYRGSRESAGAILACLMQNGVRVRWFTENEADLENVYLNITNGTDAGKDI